MKELFDILRKKLYLRHMFYMYSEQTKTNRHISPNVKLFLQWVFSAFNVSKTQTGVSHSGLKKLLYGLKLEGKG